MKHKDKITKNKKIKIQKKLKKKQKNNNQAIKESENNIASNENNNTKLITLLGKKRKLIHYKRHSLQYDDLNRLYKKAGFHTLLFLVVFHTPQQRTKLFHYYA